MKAEQLLEVLRVADEHRLQSVDQEMRLLWSAVEVLALYGTETATRTEEIERKVAEAARALYR